MRMRALKHELIFSEESLTRSIKESVPGSIEPALPMKWTSDNAASVKDDA